MRNMICINYIAITIISFRKIVKDNEKGGQPNTILLTLKEDRCTIVGHDGFELL